MAKSSGTSLTAADYQRLLDPQMRQFVTETDSHYPPDMANQGITGHRAVYDRMAAAFRAPRPASVTVRDSVLPGPLPVPLRHYSQGGGLAVVLYLHGGGFVLGGLDSHDDVCAEICDRTGFDVTSVDYRLAPEHLHPAAFDDALAAARWLCGEQPLPVVIAGDSAGANLGAAVCHAMRGDAVQPAGQVLIYAALGGDFSQPSYTEHAFAPLLTRADMEAYQHIRGGSPDDPAQAPLKDHDFTGLPPTVLVPAGIDPLRDDSTAYARAITAAGGRAACLIQQGWLHGGLRARHRADVARQAFDVIVTAIADLGAGRWPY